MQMHTRCWPSQVDDGYHYVHDVNEDETAEAADDDNEDDLRYILMQAITDADHQRLQTLSLESCALWTRFWDEQLVRAGTEVQVSALA